MAHALSIRLALGVALLLGGCAQSANSDGPASGARTIRGKKVQLPQPLPLPSQPPAVFYVETPSEGLAVLQPWVDVMRAVPIPDDAPPEAQQFRADIPETLDGEFVLAQQFESFTTPEMAKALAAAVDPSAPWAGVRIDTESEPEEIAHFRVGKKEMAELKRTMADLQTQGEFGAVILPPREIRSTGDGPNRMARSRLAWLDPRTATLSIARTERGLVTGPGIAKAYGDAPIVAAMELGLTGRVPIERVSAKGNLEKLEARVVFAEGFDLQENLPISAGAMSGLMDDPALVVGLTGRYADYEGDVKRIITRINRSVSEQPFLMRGILEDLASKGNAALRSWDGRVAAGVGPDGHLHVAYGAEDAKKSGLAVLRFLRAIKDNTDLLRKFSSDVPKLALKKSVGEGAGNPVHRFRVSGIRNRVPEEIEHLLDDKGRIQIAMAWSEHASAGMMVVGPDSVAQLERWLTASAKSKAGSESMNDLVGGTLHASPAALIQVLQAKFPEEEIFKLQPGGDKHTISAQRSEGNAYVFQITRKPGA